MKSADLPVIIARSVFSISEAFDLMRRCRAASLDSYDDFGLADQHIWDALCPRLREFRTFDDALPLLKELDAVCGADRDKLNEMSALVGSARDQVVDGVFRLAHRESEQIGKKLHLGLLADWLAACASEKLSSEARRAFKDKAKGLYFEKLSPSEIVAFFANKDVRELVRAQVVTMRVARLRKWSYIHAVSRQDIEAAIKEVLTAFGFPAHAETVRHMKTGTEDWLKTNVGKYGEDWYFQNVKDFDIGEANNQSNSRHVYGFKDVNHAFLFKAFWS